MKKPTISLQLAGFYRTRRRTEGYDAVYDRKWFDGETIQQAKDNAIKAGLRALDPIVVRYKDFAGKTMRVERTFEEFMEAVNPMEFI